MVKRFLALYRRLAAAYPHEFRMIYGEDLDRLGEDAVPEAWRRHGLWGLVRLLADIAIRLPVEYLSEMRRDVTYALRGLAGSPGFAAVAVLSLAIGIGMCAVILNGSNGIVAPPPGVEDPASLLAFQAQTSYPYFEHYRDQRQVVASAAALLRIVPLAVARSRGRHARSERFWGHLVSPEYFSTLGVAPLLGRFFRPDFEKPGAAPAVVVSERFWRAYLNADPQAVGTTLQINGQVATVVGVGPKDFLGVWPWNPADLFVPVTTAAALAPELAGDTLHRRDREIFHVVLRLAPGVTLARAEGALTSVTHALDRESLDKERQRDRAARQVRLMPAGTTMWVLPELNSAVHTFNLTLWALVLSLLCANLANLLLARGIERGREIAVRLSVGASRLRLIRQLLTESVMLSVAGGVCGVALALVVIRFFTSRWPPSEIPVQMHPGPDLTVLLTTLAVAALAGIGFGLVPALASVRTDLAVTLKQGGQAHAHRWFGLRNLFVVYQVVSSLMLLLVTGFMVRGWHHSTRIDPGFDTANIDLLSLDPLRDGYSAARAEALFRALPDELSQVTGVRRAALAGGAPFANFIAERPNGRVSARQEGRDVTVPAFRQRIGKNYFATLGVPVRGREFNDHDATGVIINETAARQFFGAEDPIGRPLVEATGTYTVVGVTRDVASGFLVLRTIPTLFLPLTPESFQRDWAQGATLIVRAAADRETLATLRERMTALHPDLTVFNVRTMRQDMDRASSFLDWTSAMYAVFGLFALLLACIGLAAVTAYAVARRRKEIGIRMALGARAGQVRRLVLSEGTALIAAGTLLGFAGAVALTRALSTTTAIIARGLDISASDPVLVFGAPLLLAALALIACYLPARRATRIDPVTTLREE